MHRRNHLLYKVVGNIFYLWTVNQAFYSLNHLYYPNPNRGSISSWRRLSNRNGNLRLTLTRFFAIAFLRERSRKQCLRVKTTYTSLFNIFPYRIHFKTSVMPDNRVLENIPILALSVHSKIFNSRKDFEESIINIPTSPFILRVSNHRRDPSDLQSSSRIDATVAWLTL